MQVKMFFRLSAALALIAGCGARDEAVSWNAETHSVTFTAVYSGCGMDTPLEFLFAAKGTDKDYETLFLTDASPGEIAAAFEKAQIPSGGPIDKAECRLWPSGASLKLDEPLANLVIDTTGKTPAMLYTGGTRCRAGGTPVADTNMPMAVFALYNVPQSLIQFDDSLEQGMTYGRFRPAVKMAPGERRKFTFTLENAAFCKRTVLEIAPGKAAEALEKLRRESEGCELDVLCAFSPEMTVEEAAAVSTALASLDSPKVKINGAREGELYFRAYLPLEKWRDRRERLAQPPEVHFDAAGGARVVEIKEDWSDPSSLDPKLDAIETRHDDIASAAAQAAALAERTSSILLFVPPGTKLEALYRFKRMISGTILNWYVFTE